MAKRIYKLIDKYKGMSIAVKAALWFTFCNIIQRGINFITMPVFTRIMPTADFGIYTVYNSWYNIISIFATLNLSAFIFSKGMVKFKEDRDGFELSLQSLNLTITLVLALFYYAFRNPINSFTGLTTIITALMFIEIAMQPSIHYWTARNRFEYKYKKVVAVTLTIAFGNTLLGIILVLLLPDPAIARIISVVAISLAFGVAAIYRISKNAKGVFSIKYWKYALDFNLPLIPHFLSASILNQSDRIMISNMVGSAEAAIYSVAYSVSMMPMLLSTAIQQSFLPWLYQKMSDNKSDNISKVTNATLLLMMSIIMLLIAFGPEVIAVVAPPHYAAAKWIIPPVCGSVYFVFLHNMFANIEYYFEETKKIALASVGVAALNIVLNFIFIRIFGYLAAGYTTLICYIAYTIVHYFVMRNVCKIHNYTDILFDIKTITYLSILFVIAVLFISALYEMWYVRYAIILLIILVGVLKKKQVVSLVNAIKNK